jgi:hypothetical protein
MKLQVTTTLIINDIINVQRGSTFHSLQFCKISIHGTFPPQTFNPS